MISIKICAVFTLHRCIPHFTLGNIMNTSICLADCLAEMKSIASIGYMDRNAPKVCTECHHSTIYRAKDGLVVRVRSNTQTHPVCTRCRICYRRAITDGHSLQYVLPEGVHFACMAWGEASNEFINRHFYALDELGGIVDVFPTYS